MIDISDVIISNLYENVTHEARLKGLLSKASRVDIVCPFISSEGIKWLIEGKKATTQVEVITELSVRSVVSGVQSLEALSALISAGCAVRYLTSGLHAKMYFFDQAEVLLTSANMTRNGLRRNFEVGLAVSSHLLSERMIKNADQVFSQRIKSLWEFLKKQSVELSPDLLATYREIEAESRDIRRQHDQLEAKYAESVSEFPFVTNQRDCPNIQNISTDLLSTALFAGFLESDWDVFDHQLSLNDENLSLFRQTLTERINPRLSAFYSQLKNEPIFNRKLSALDRGFSANLQLKQRFPNDRYMFLTKPRAGKTSRKHIGEASIIIGMGKDMDTGTRWLEVRTGVEEEVLPKLTESGKHFISELLENRNDVSERLKSLGSGWSLVHGVGEGYRSVPADQITPEKLRSEIAHYLETEEISDLQIRRKYHLGDDGDKAVLLSPRITSVIARDIEKLAYFFDLASLG